MMMKRRDFLGLAAKLTAVSSVPAVLSACGGSSGSTSSDSPISSSSVSSIDQSLASVDQQQTELDSTHNESTSFNNEVANGDANASVDSGTKTTAALDLKNAPLADQAAAINRFYSTRTPDYSNSALLSRGAHYLLPSNDSSDSIDAEGFWKTQTNAHNHAYSQYLNQITKLKATARLFDSKINASEATTKNGASSKSLAMVVNKLEPAEADQITDLLGAISAIANQALSVSVLDLILSALNTVYDYLVQSITDIAFKVAANLAIDSLLQNLANLTLEDLDFSDKEATMLSLAKISVASIAIVGATKIQEVDDASNSDVEQELIELLVSSSNLTGKMSSVWLALMNQVMGNTFAQMNNALTSSVAASSDNSVNWEADQSTLVENLQQNSSLLAILSMIVKAMFSIYQDQALVGGDDENTQSFNTGSTAEQYAILFGSEKSVDDQALTAFTSDNLNDMIAGLATLFDKSSEENTEEAASFKTIAAVTQSAVTSEQGTATIEADAVSFAEKLADYAFQFTADTESDAYSFASELANLAYQFTMKIEDDAYNFAMQGMEYGYLFASRGEEVGVMADRILWMAVQIGVMADRIGEMADRIVYTEQLIVYTEILILDFGVLIYGTIKQIINLILTGLALILDREWYAPSSEDVVLDFINGNVSTMLSNMHEYSLAILEQQKALRELTLDALDTVNFAETAA